MEGESSTQMMRFFTRYLPIAFTFSNDVAFLFGIFFENPKIFVWARRMQFSQHCRKFFAKNPNLFRSKSGNIYKIIFFHKKSFCSNCSSGHVECSFDNPAENFSLKVKIVLSNQKNHKFIKFPIFLANVPLDT